MAADQYFGEIAGDRGTASMPEAGTRQLSVVPPPESAVATFAATPSQVHYARRFLAELLDSSPLVDDAVLCLSELATNAVRHSDSRQPGGVFRVQATALLAGVHVDVTDAGGPWLARYETGRDSGHGLAIVAALATGWGITETDRARTVWFEITR